MEEGSLRTAKSLPSLTLERKVRLSPVRRSLFPLSILVLNVQACGSLPLSSPESPNWGIPIRFDESCQATSLELLRHRLSARLQDLHSTRSAGRDPCERLSVVQIDCINDQSFLRRFAAPPFLTGQDAANLSPSRLVAFLTYPYIWRCRTS